MGKGRIKKILKPSSSGGPGQRKAAKVMKEPASSFPGGAKQRFVVAQRMGRSAAGKAAARKR